MEAVWKPSFPWPSASNAYPVRRFQLTSRACCERPSLSRRSVRLARHDTCLSGIPGMGYRSDCQPLAWALPLGRPVIHWPAAPGLCHRKRDQTLRRVSSKALCSALLCLVPLVNVTALWSRAPSLPGHHIHLQQDCRHLIPAVGSDSSRDKSTRFLKLNTDLIWSAVHIRK